MAALGLHPRLARLVTAGEDLGIPRLARLGAALLETGELEARTRLGRFREEGHALDSDLLLRLDQFEEARAAGFSPGACRAAGLDPGALRQARAAYGSLLAGAPREEERADGESLLLQALLRAYPDRVARVGGNGTCALVGGGGARLDPACRVRRAEWILALEAEGGSQVLVRAASRLEPDWLLDAFPEAIRETEDLAFNPASGRVDLRSRIWYEDLCLDDSRRPAPLDHPRTAALLAQAALEGGLGEDLEAFLARVAFLARQRPDLGLPEPGETRAALVTEACRGLGSLKELQGADWAWTFRSLWGPDAARLLETWAPPWVQLPKRRARVDYRGEAPAIASRLQDFLGMQEGPRVAGGAVPLVLHLLAPNQRAVQVTTDLRGFWERAYRELRPQLSRRYPRHLWPEDPAR
jgi:ATP-dependent helicase HrpB